MSETENLIDKDDERRVRFHLWLCVPLLIIGIVTPFAAYFSVLLPSEELPKIWFQRSGSLTVLFAVWMEYNLIKINENINLSGIITNEQGALSEKYLGIYKVAQYVAVALAVLGTFIWGYGDLFK